MEEFGPPPDDPLPPLSSSSTQIVKSRRRLTAHAEQLILALQESSPAAAGSRTLDVLWHGFLQRRNTKYWFLLKRNLLMQFSVEQDPSLGLEELRSRCLSFVHLPGSIVFSSSSAPYSFEIQSQQENLHIILQAKSNSEMETWLLRVAQACCSTDSTDVGSSTAPSSTQMRVVNQNDSSSSLFTFSIEESQLLWSQGAAHLAGSFVAHRGASICIMSSLGGVVLLLLAGSDELADVWTLRLRHASAAQRRPDSLWSARSSSSHRSSSSYRISSPDGKAHSASSSRSSSSVSSLASASGSLECWREGAGGGDSSSPFSVFAALLDHDRLVWWIEDDADAIAPNDFLSLTGGAKVELVTKAEMNTIFNTTSPESEHFLFAVRDAFGRRVLFETKTRAEQVHWCSALGAAAISLVNVNFVPPSFSASASSSSSFSGKIPGARFSASLIVSSSVLPPSKGDTQERITLVLDGSLVFPDYPFGFDLARSVVLLPEETNDDDIDSSLSATRSLSLLTSDHCLFHFQAKDNALLALLTRALTRAISAALIARPSTPAPPSSVWALMEKAAVTPMSKRGKKKPSSSNQSFTARRAAIALQAYQTLMKSAMQWTSVSQSSSSTSKVAMGTNTSTNTDTRQRRTKTESRRRTVVLEQGINHSLFFGSNVAQDVDLSPRATSSTVPPSPSSSSIPQRDFYGFIVSHPLLFAQFTERFVSRLADQSSRFESLVASPARFNAADIDDAVASGIPPKYRGKFWTLFAGVDVRRVTHPNYYASLTRKSEAHETAVAAANPESNVALSPVAVALSPTILHQIEIDLARTFPGLVDDEEECAKLRRVLVAYALYNPDIGYAQGLNFLVGMLQVFMDEEDSFWMLAWIVEELMPLTFSERLVGAFVDARVLHSLLTLESPALSEHFERLDLLIDMFFTSWSMCLFVINLPSETAFRIWDRLFHGGPCVLFETALRILRLFEKSILAIDSAFDILTFLSTETAKLYEPAVLLDLRLRIVRVSNGQVGLLRQHFRSEVVVE